MQHLRPAQGSPLNPQTQKLLQHHLPNEVVVPIAQSPAAAQSNPQPPPLPPNLPCLDLIQGSREEYLEIGVPLYEASVKGDWKAAKAILDKGPELVRFAITENFETPLHIAVSTQSTKSVEDFVKNLVGLMEKKDLELQNRSYNTAMCLAATSGNVETAKIMVAKNKAVLQIPGSSDMLPLYVAALFARERMVRYLYDLPNSMTGDYWNNSNRSWVLQKCVEADFFDVALKIVKDHPRLISEKGTLRDVLVALAPKTDAFEEKKPNFIVRIFKSLFSRKAVDAEQECDALQLLRIIWKTVVIMPKKDIDEILRGPRVHQNNNTSGIGKERITYPYRVLFVAAKVGNKKFIVELIRSYPDVIWKVNDKGLTIFHIAVKRRRANIYNMLYEIGSMKDLITPIKEADGNNMLHLVAKGGKRERFQNVSGVALQMQYELLWYKEVERMIPPSYRQRRNKRGETPRDIFTRTHESLLAEGERWMKETAPQCMVVATLVATMVFAAAFTLPGGYDQNTGIPLLRQDVALMVFVVADAISLIASSATVLTFLSIFTRRFAEIDFLESLPRTLMFGLATLFISVVTMMIAFCASFFLLYKNKSIWLPIMVTTLAAIPLLQYGFRQSRFLGDVFYSTYRSKSLFVANKRMLY